MKLKIAATLLFVSVFCQNISGRENTDKVFKPSVLPFLKLQFWNVYSEGIHYYENVAANRVASYFRRGRAGLQGKMLPEVSYNLMLSFDNLAKDENLSTKGANTGGVSVWSFYLTWNLIPGNDWLNVSGGYFLPHLSRESTTSPWTVSSLDKTETSCYLRQFVTGKTNGISPGINIGGLGQVGKQTFVYNASLINRQDNTNIQTIHWSPVLLGHFMLNFGEPEFQKYTYTFSNNILKKQTSATIGLGFSKQGETDVFKSSSTLGIDATIYLRCLKMDGEFYRLHRRNDSEYLAHCVMGRISCNVFLENDWILEPVVMYEQFKGDKNYSDASFFDGKDKITDLGLNLISKQRNIKLNLHYVFHDGKGVKNHYINNGTYPGNYAVFGIQFII